MRLGNLSADGSFMRFLVMPLSWHPWAGATQTDFDWTVQHAEVFEQDLVFLCILFSEASWPSLFLLDSVHSR